MKLDINREIAALGGMSTAQLCERYAELFGEPVRTRHKTYLIRKIAWRLQATAEGDLSERARRRAEELANDAEVRVMPPRNAHPPITVRADAAAASDARLPRPGTALVRKYKGRQVRVLVLADGFEYERQHFGSLSAVAKAIDCIVVYKVDRLSRSLLDFAKIMEVFDQRKVAFVSVTQQFNTSTPMGRLTCTTYRW